MGSPFKTATEYLNASGTLHSFTGHPGIASSKIAFAANRDPGRFPAPTRSTSAAATGRTSGSATAITTASARRWPGSSCRSG